MSDLDVYLALLLGLTVTQIDAIKHLVLRVEYMTKGDPRVISGSPYRSTG
jgi:hypothetical protein